jgi:hypothetical protein
MIGGLAPSLDTKRKESIYISAVAGMYIHERKRFMALLPDATTRPYKKLVGFRKWEDDSVLLSDKS